MESSNAVNPEVEFRKAMEEEYPETTAEFRKIVEEQYMLFLRKHHDYGSANIAVGTACRSPKEIKMSIMGIWFRSRDKIERLKNLLFLRDEAKAEPMEDSWKDIANYGIIAQIVERGKWGK